MNIGSFDTMLFIEQSTGTRNTIGESIKTWNTVMQLWGKCEQKSSGESNEANQKVGSEIIAYTTHRYDGVTQAMRGYMNGVYWDILKVDYSDRAKMVLELKKKDNQ